MPFVSDNNLKIFEVCKMVYAFLRRQVFARYPKPSNVVDSNLLNAVSIKYTRHYSYAKFGTFFSATRYNCFILFLTLTK